MPPWDTVSPQRLLLEFLFLKIIGSQKNKMCSTVHAVYVIQKVLQKHNFIVLVAEGKVLLVSGKSVLNSASPLTRKCQNTKFDLCQMISFQRLEIKAGFDLTSHVVSRDLKWYYLMTTVNPACLQRNCSCSMARHRRWAGEDVSLTTRHKTAAWLSASPPAAATQLCLSPRWTGERVHLLLFLPASIPSTGWAWGARFTFCHNTGRRL